MHRICSICYVICSNINPPHFPVDGSVSAHKEEKWNSATYIQAQDLQVCKWMQFQWLKWYNINLHQLRIQPPIPGPPLYSSPAPKLVLAQVLYSSVATYYCVMRLKNTRLFFFCMDFSSIMLNKHFRSHYNIQTGQI